MPPSSIGGSLQAFQLRQPDEVDAHLIVARDLLPAVAALSEVEGIPLRGCAMLGGHVTECLLKAIILSTDTSEEFDPQERKALKGHDLNVLWELAARSDRIVLPKDPPDWLKILAVGHGPNYYLRYQRGVEKAVVNGGQMPDLRSMVSALLVLRDQVLVASGRG